LDNNIGSRRGFVQYALEFFQNADALRLLADSDIYWDKVDTVTDLGQTEKMFDFEAEDKHNYVANVIISHNSSMAERLKELMELYPIYVLSFVKDVSRPDDLEHSPVFESPLALFSATRYHDKMQKEYGIDKRYLSLVLSPWAIKRLKQAGGDVTRFRATRMMPSKLEQIGIAKTEPGDENNQDISSLVGKTDIRMLEKYSQNDPDAYSFSGALCRANQGIMEFVEMFKAPIKVLHPLLTATQEGNYMGTEAISAIPFNGMILAHCFSDDTELLTATGWRKVDEIEVGTSFATINMDTRLIEYQPALKKFVYDHDGPIYQFKSKKCADHLVTAEHNMIYESYWDKTLRIVKAKDFTMPGHRIIVSAVTDRPDLADWTDDEIRLMVWTVTDGHLSSGKVRFGFKKQRKVDRLTALLQRMNIVATFKFNDESLVHAASILFPDKCAVKSVPEDIRFLSARQIRVFLEEWSHTDGSIYGMSGDRVRTSQLCSNVPRHKDIIQELATIAGHKCTAVTSVKEGYDDVWMMNIHFDKTTIKCDYFNKGTVPYVGRTWCVTVANHSVFARRNGKIMLTGQSNEAEWQTFKANRNNEAFIDRICVIKVPYCLRVTDELEIYNKMIATSELKDAPLAPSTLVMLSQWSVLTRLKKHENSTPWSKMRVYDGENIKETDPRARSVQEYRDVAGVDEGMDGASTRFAFKVLSTTYNHDPEEVAADPVHLMYALERAIIREQYSDEIQKVYLDYIKSEIAPRYSEFIGNEISQAYLETYNDFGQTLFDRYHSYAFHWLNDIDFKDPDTGTMFERDYLNSELEKIEKPAGISNPKDFRNECVMFILRMQAGHKHVKWTSYEKLKKVIEKKMFANVDELLPVISFGKKASIDDDKKHVEFVSRMMAKGYTEKQVRRAVEWYQRVHKAQ
jgi:predicted Ser/Thr protein kinase